MELKGMILEVPYNSQRDNQIKPSGACNITAQWMQFSEGLVDWNFKDDNLMQFLSSSEAMDYFGRTPNLSWAKRWKEREKLEQLWAMLEWSGTILYGCTMENYDPHTFLQSNPFDTLYQLENKYKDKYKFKMSSFDDIIDSLNLGFPVVSGGKFTASGHFICIVGYLLINDVINFVVHDSWGDATNGYRSSNGEYRVYTGAYLDNTLHKDNDRFRTLIFTNYPDELRCKYMYRNL